jgi:paraquat-inducible protein A
VLLKKRIEVSMADRPGKLIACHDCDLLQREIPLRKGCAASCSRCGAKLYRNATDSIDRTLAYMLAAGVLYVIANTNAIFGIEANGALTTITLYQAVGSLWDQDMKLVACVVFITAILVPAVELVSLVYLLVPLKQEIVPRGYTLLMRTLQYVRPWSMIEVLMLGVLVSLVKLTNNFKVVTGVALWSFAGLTLLLAAAAASFSARDVWSRIDEVTGREPRS